MANGQPKWRTYEEVATYLLDKISEEIGLVRVEGKQLLAGSSGTNWEIDAKGVKADGEAFLVVECKRWPKDRVSQATIGGMACAIEDTGADGGVLVSPLGLQEGAAKVAEWRKILDIRLHPDSSETEYMLLLEFAKKAFIGVSDTGGSTDEAQVLKYEEGQSPEAQ